MNLLLWKKKKKIRVNKNKIGYNSEEDVVELINNIKSKIKMIFKSHIGENNAIMIDDLFERIFGDNYHDVEIYKRNYWLQVILVIIRQLRSKDECFIIKKRNSLFVLKTADELDYYKRICNRDIESLENAKRRAYDWVNKEKWRNI